MATNLLDVPAEVIALIYRKRWTVELFFGFFKYGLGCRHLLSHGANGIEIQVYLAIIVCMLIALWTGKKPTLRTIEMIRLYFTCSSVPRPPPRDRHLALGSGPAPLARLSRRHNRE